MSNKLKKMEKIDLGNGTTLYVDRPKNNDNNNGAQTPVEKEDKKMKKLSKKVIAGAIAVGVGGLAIAKALLLKKGGDSSDTGDVQTPVDNASDDNSSEVNDEG